MISKIFITKNKSILFSFWGYISLLCLLFMISELSAQEDRKGFNGDLLDMYIKSKGNEIIVFNPSNIKQYWIERDVLSQKDYFQVFLNPKKRKPSIKNTTC